MQRSVPLVPAQPTWAPQTWAPRTEPVFSVQREESAAPAEVPAPAHTPEPRPAEPPPVAGAPAGADAAPAPAVQAEQNPDELVKKLYDPLLRRLKTELRLDRERRGVLTDPWH